MESQINQKLFLVAIFSIILSNFECVQIVVAETEAESPTSFPPTSHVSFPPSESYSPSDSLPPSDSPSEAFAVSNSGDISLFSSSTKIDGGIKQICDTTDYPSICLETIVPVLTADKSADMFSVLETSITATNEYAKYALSMAEKLALTPGTPPELVSILKECKESYEDVLYNFANALESVPNRDLGTINTMLSAVITYAGDCADEFNGSSFPCPLAKFGEKLIQMTSNCLAIASLVQY